MAGSVISGLGRQDLFVDSQVEQHCSLYSSREHACAHACFLPPLVHRGPQTMRWCHYIQGALANQLWKHPHRHSQKYALLISKALLHPTKLTIKINQHRHHLSCCHGYCFIAQLTLLAVQCRYECPRWPF